MYTTFKYKANIKILYHLVETNKDDICAILRKQEVIRHAKGVFPLNES